MSCCGTCDVLRFHVRARMLGKLMRALLIPLLLLTALVTAATPQKCREIRGRAVLRRFDGFFSIWHVGTDHLFMPADKQSADLICKYFDCESGDKQPALFANFEVCPTERFIEGAAQPVIVKRVWNTRVIPEWPPESSK